MVTRVYCEAAGMCIPNSHLCCSERRLLFMLERRARQEGLKGDKIIEYVRRKTGGWLVVWRTTQDGQYACALPCVCCSKTIERYGLKIMCSVDDAHWYRGPITDVASKLTSRQQRWFSGDKKSPLMLRV